MTSQIKTNIKWLPYIASDWRLGKVKQKFYISKELSYKENPTILSLARSGVKIRDISTNEGQLAASYDNYNSVKVGDLLLNPMDLYSGANCNVSNVEGVISPAYSNLRAKVQLVPKFYDYYFKVQYWTMAMFAHGKGVSFDNRWTLSAETLLNYEIPVPSYEEQNEIVSFLDKKINQIDSLIANQEHQIKKLKEYKKALITKTVTFGLNTNNELKYSNIEWIGKINKKYEIIRFRFLASITTGDHDTQDSDPNGQYPLYVRSPNIERSMNFTFDGEGILMAGDGAGAGKIFHHVFGKYAVHQRVYRFFDFKRTTGDYLHYYLSSMFYKTMEYGSAQTTVPSVRLNMILNFPVVVPDAETQKGIVNFLNEKCASLDKIIIDKQSKINTLESLKKSLIYEYVTGKKRVEL